MKKIFYTIIYLLCSSSLLHSQGLNESFDNFANLAGLGWSAQNVSQPLGTVNWQQGNPDVFPAFSGGLNAYAMANFNSGGGGSNTTISNWLITPVVTLNSGGVLTFYTRKTSPSDWADRLEVRMSTAGASTNVGGGATTVGDFTTLLLTINPTLTLNGYPFVWTQYTINLCDIPQNTQGRLAFRYFVTNGGPDGLNSDFIGIDEVVYTPNPNPTTVSFAPIGDVCSNTPPFPLTGGSPSGGTYAINGNNATDFDASTFTGSSHVVSYTFNAGVGCNITVNQNVNIIPSPTASLAAFNPICVNASPLTLTGGLPLGGQYSGVGVDNGVFDPSIAGIGTHTITYSFTEANGCTDEATQSINVTGTLVTLTPFSTVCITSGNLILDGATPAGGTFSGPGVSGTTFDPTVAGVGTHDITYSFDDGNCISTATETVQVVDATPATLTSFSPICVSDSPLALTGGSPSGGVYSGAGVDNGFFDPSVTGVGTFTITYTYGGGTACQSEATQSITVTGLVAEINSILQLCEIDNPFTLNIGTPIGGTYSGPGISGNILDPALAGAGQHTVTYTVTDGTCTSIATEDFFVIPSLQPTIETIAPLCVGNAEVEIITNPDFLIDLSGPGVANGFFNPAQAGVGTHTITAIYAAGTTCQSSSTLTVEVTGTQAFLPVVNDLCANDAPVDLNPSPAGGTLTGTGVVGNTFDPTVAGLGTFVIEYTIDDNGCISTASQTVTVNDFIEAQLTTFNAVCVNEAPFVLNNGNPSGGLYSGNGVINGVFNPSIAGLGIHIITYTLGLGTTCESSESQEIVVNGVPLISITPVSDVCLSSGLVNLSATPSGGDFTGNGVVDSDIFDPTIAGIGNHTIMYSFTDIEGCSSVESITITVTDDVEVNIGNLNPVCTNSSPITLNTGSPAGGTYSGDGVSNNIFNPSLLGPGTYTITYTYSENGCEGSASTEVVVNQAPTVNLSPFDKLCIYNESFALTGGSPAGGTYSGPGVSNNSFNPAGAGIGLHTITYTFTNANGCSGSATQTISVEECLGMDNISISNSLQIYPNPTSDRLNIQFNTWVNSDFKITLISYTGAVISEKIVRSHIGEFTENLHLGDLRKGVYFIRITTPKEVITQKVILQ